MTKTKFINNHINKLSMKHNLRITLLLLFLFVASQVTGLFLISRDAEIGEEITPDNKTIIVVRHDETAIGDRPNVEGYSSLLYILGAVAIGTLLILMIIRFNKTMVWRGWFFLAVFLTLSISLGVLFKNKYVIWGTALVLAFLKISRFSSVLLHNITEVLIYSGIAVLIVPLFSVFWAFVLLLVISVYDMFAVWKSKHMVKMAKFQFENSIFPGLMIPYSKGKIGKLKSKTKAVLREDKAEKTIKTKANIAILGGGDIAFPLIFSGAVMESLIMNGLTKGAAFLQTSIITFTTTLALFLLFLYSKKKHYYPAMPFVTLGCLVGYFIVFLL